MSRVQSRDDRNGRWFYDKAEIEQTPSRRDGIDKFHELQYRQRAASLIQVFFLSLDKILKCGAVII